MRKSSNVRGMSQNILVLPLSFCWPVTATAVAVFRCGVRLPGATSSCQAATGAIRGATRDRLECRTLMPDVRLNPRAEAVVRAPSGPNYNDSSLGVSQVKESSSRPKWP